MHKQLLVLFVFASFSLAAQEFSTGLGAGIGPNKYNNYFTFNSYFEIRPKKYFSFNFDPNLLTWQEKTIKGEIQNNIWTFPVYVKYRHSDNAKVLPFLGLFYRSNENRGWMSGLNVEITNSKKLKFTLQGFIYRDSWFEDWRSPGGAPYTVKLKAPIRLAVNFGVKRIIWSK